MKGHTRIELKDVYTGKVQAVDEDNMVTLGLQKMLQPYAFSTNNFMAKNQIIGNAIGGLLLFEDSIEENINNYIPPSNNRMTGRGVYGKTYTGNVTELGSFNENESGLQDDGSVKLVWDFNTSQANGKISCVSLTSLLGGNLGLGDIVYEKQNSLTMHKLGRVNCSYDACCMQYVSFDENMCLVGMPFSENMPNVTGALKFKKARFPISNISLFDKCAYRGNTNDGSVTIDMANDVEELSFILPQEIMNTFGTSGNNIQYKGGYIPFFADGKIRFIFSTYNQNVAADGIFYLVIIDVAGNKLEVKQITNKTGCEIVYSQQSSNNSTNRSFLANNKIAVTSKYIFCIGLKDGVYKLFRININDNTDVVELAYSKSSDNIVILMTTDEKIFFRDNNEGYVIDVESCAVSFFDYISTLWDTYDYTYQYMIHGNKMLLFKIKNEYREYTYIIELTQYPIPIHTINNLATPVTKTSAHTMKVTYTLSENTQ